MMNFGGLDSIFLLKDGQSLKDLYEERVPLYEKYADITIDEDGKDLDESLRAILEIIHIKEQGKWLLQVLKQIVVNNFCLQMINICYNIQLTLK